MSKTNDAFDRAFEEMMKEAAVIADEHIGKKLKEPEEEIIFSKEHESKMHNLFQKERRKLLVKDICKWSKRCACVLAAALIVGSVTIGSVSAWRSKVLNFIYDKYSPNTDYYYSYEEGTFYSDDNVTMDYIPQGFECIGFDGVFYEFKSETQYFILEIVDLNARSNIDTEDAIVEELTINGNRAISSVKPNITILIWSDKYHTYIISGDISKEETIKIAEHTNHG